MERPVDIVFHNTDRSETVEADIRARVEKLEKRFPHMTGCRVSIEGRDRQHHTGQAWDVHLVMSVPGQDLAVSREPHKNKGGSSHPDLAGSLREAFKAAEKQLDAYKARLSGEAVLPTGSALAGRIVQIEPGEDHGYLLNATGSQLYFHRDSVTNARFEDLREGDTVHYVEEEGDAGPVATKVRVPVSPG
jgi:cold shock CspA family protein/ribosome-associated translation inhibitor RaiA